MKNRKWYEWLLPLVYFLMVALCVYLNLTQGQKEDPANIIVNGLMFMIVAVIFLTCRIGSFDPMNRIIADLERVTFKIRSDALNSHEYLWDPYKNIRNELFDNNTLKDIFQDYLFELNRKKDAKNAYYKCDIADYINEELIDRTMHRNQLNQVAGALTGLGILGTFIGLSLGLQSFNTGTTAEITNSIEPLMNGIKVAFHTSIYGMIFSLVFNYVYKRKLYEAENTVSDFVSVYKRFVLPDTSNDGTNRMIELLEAQVRSVAGLKESISSDMVQVMTPPLEQLGRSINDFQRAATEDQRTAISVVVDAFLQHMDASLQGSFAKLSDSIDRQVQLCNANAKEMQQIINGVGANAEGLGRMQQASEDLMRALQGYGAGVEMLQKEMQQNITGLSMLQESGQLLMKRTRESLNASIKEAGTVAREVIDACDDVIDAIDSTGKDKRN